MKKRYQILIVIFVAVLSLFIIRGDAKLALDRISSYFHKSNNITEEVKLVEQKEIQLPGKIDTPGALRVVDNLLSTRNETKLSKDKIIEITNKYRTEIGKLPILAENQKLDLSAQKKLQDMFTKQYFEHVSPSGIDVGDLGQKVLYNYILIGENLALGNFKDDQALVDAWMASEGHRANILNGHYTEIGVAVGKGNFEGKDTWIAVQHFGTPKSVCSTIDEILLGTISINQNEIKSTENDLIIRKEMIEKREVYEGSTYLEQIRIYNDLVIYYNKLITETKQKINIYNNQVQAFNDCLLEKTSNLSNFTTVG